MDLKNIMVCGKVMNKMSPHKTTDAGNQYFFHEFPFFVFNHYQSKMQRLCRFFVVPGIVYIQFLFEMNIFLIF